jgi:hypothetical protein
MSIFGIMIIALLIAMLIGVIVWGGLYLSDVWDDRFGLSLTIVIVTTVVILVAGTLLGIGLETEGQRVFVAKYEIQKETVERSLASGALTPMERIELVNKVVDLNGELAERKASCSRWHVVLYDKHIFDNVEFINLD